MLMLLVLCGTPSFLGATPRCHRTTAEPTFLVVVHEVVDAVVLVDPSVERLDALARLPSVVVLAVAFVEGWLACVSSWLAFTLSALVLDGDLVV